MYSISFTTILTRYFTAEAITSPSREQCSAMQKIWEVRRTRLDTVNSFKFEILSHVRS